MDKYIDRDKLAEFARHSTIGIDANDIMRFPTADVVEVVRCKDCIHFSTANDGYCIRPHNGLHITEANDFCSYGERKETE